MDRIGIHVHRADAVLDHCGLRKMIGAQHIDGDIEATLQLVAMIGDIGQSIGWDTVALDHHSIFFVAESRAAEPGRWFVTLALTSAISSASAPSQCADS